MKFWYDVIECHYIDIDFQKLVDFIKSKYPEIKTVNDLYYEFMDNLDYYINTVFNCDDFVEEDNDWAITDLKHKLEDYLDEVYGECWDNEI